MLKSLVSAISIYLKPKPVIWKLKLKLHLPSWWIFNCRFPYFPINQYQFPQNLNWFYMNESESRCSLSPPLLVAIFKRVAVVNFSQILCKTMNIECKCIIYYRYNSKVCPRYLFLLVCLDIPRVNQWLLVGRMSCSTIVGSFEIFTCGWW